MVEASGKHYIDGRDLWTVFSIFVEGGSDDFLKFAARKDSIVHDWLDRNGQEVDTSRPFVNSRSIQLRCAMIVQSESEFWNKYNAFITLMMQPETRRVIVVEFGDRYFDVYYKECTSFTRFTRIKNTTKIAIRFTLILIEAQPQLDTSLEYLVDETGRYLTT